MNIATGLLDAPTVKTASILDAIMSKGLVGKALPEALGISNYGLSAGIGAGGSELLRRGLRRTNLNPYLADAIGVGAGGLVGGGSGAGGALLARVSPQVGGATAGRATKNLLGATAAGAGVLGLGEGAYKAYQAANEAAGSGILERISDMYSKAVPGIQRATLGGAAATGGLATLNRNARRYLAGLGTSATGGSLLAPVAGVTAGLGAPIAGAGILGAAGLKNQAVRTGIADSYRFLRDAPGGSVLAGLGGLTAASKLAPALYKAPEFGTLLKTMGDSPLTMGAAGGLAGLGALLNPTIRGGLRKGIVGTARGLYNAPGGSVLAGLGGLTAASKLAPALYNTPELATLLKTMGDSPLTMGAAGSLAALGALRNPTIRGGLRKGIVGTARGLYNAPAGSVLAGLGGLTAASKLAPALYNTPELATLLKTMGDSPLTMGAAGGLAGLGALRSGMTRGSMINRIARNAPGGTLPALAGAGLFAAGHPVLGATSMLSAPMVNRTSSRYIGDLLREFRAMRSNKRALDGLYKKSSLEKKSHIKLAAPVFLTKPSYILDAPTMEKLGNPIGGLGGLMHSAGEALFKGVEHFGAKATRGAKGMFRGQTRAMNRATEGLMRGAREAGKPLTRQQAQRQAELFLREGQQVTARTNPGSFSARSGPQTQFQNTGDVLQARVNENVQGRSRLNRFFGGGFRQRGRNIKNLEEQMYQHGLKGTTPTAPTANPQAATEAQAALVDAQRASNRARMQVQDLDAGYTYRNPDGTMGVVPGVQGAQAEVTRLTAPVQTAQQKLEVAEQAAQQARQNYFQTHFGINAPTLNLTELEGRLAQLRADQRSLNPFRTNPSSNRIKSLEDQIKALEATERAVATPVQPGLGATEVGNLLRQDEAAIKSTYEQLQRDITTAGTATPEQQSQLNLLQEYMRVNPATSVQQVAAEGSPEITNVLSRLSGAERTELGLNKVNGVITNSPAEIRQNIINKITELEANPGFNDALLAKLKNAEVTVTTPSQIEFTGEGFVGLQGRLNEIEQNLARQTDYAGVTSAEAATNPLRTTLQREQAALTPAQERLTQATADFNAAQRASLRASQDVTRRTDLLDQARQAQQRTTDLLREQAPLTTGGGSKLKAPIQESLAKTKAKPEVVDAIGQAGLGQSGQVNQRLVRLEASGVNTGELINTTANSAGLPKAVQRVNKASDSLIAEATANMNLATNEAEALNMAVRKLTAEGKSLNAAEIDAALGGIGNTNINAAADELARLTAAGSGSRAGEAYNQASTASREAYQKFTNQLEDQISRATGRADIAGLERTNKAIGEATKTERSFMDVVRRRNKGIADRTPEQIAAFNEMGALTNARVEAIRAEVALKGPNAAVAESTIPQIRSASEAIANSNNPQAAAEWSRMLQDPGNIAANARALPKDSPLRGLLEQNAPRLLKKKDEAAFALSNRSARTLEEMIPRGGRGAQGIDAEVSRVFNRDVLSRPESVEGQELIRMMDGSGAPKIKINGTDTNLGQALEQLNRGTGTQRSAAQKLMEGAENASAFTAEELGHLGVTPVAADANMLGSFRGSGATANNLAEVNATVAEAAAGNRSSIKQQVEYLEKELLAARQKKPKKKATPADLAAAEKRQNALADALDSVREAERQTNTVFETNLLQPMSKARNSLRESIAKDTYVDIGNLQRNTDVASIRVGDDFAKLYREPQLTEEGVAVFNPADITKQINQLKKNPRNSMVTEEALTDRVIMENLEIFRAKNPEATQEQLQAAYQGLLEASGRGQADVMQLVAGGQQGGLGVGGMLGGTAVIGGGAYAANNRPTPITQAGQQMRPAASWGLSPLQAPVQYRKKTASLLAAPLHKLAKDMPKPLKVPLPKFKPNQMTKAPVKAEDVGIASPLTSMLTAPVAGGGY